MKVRALRLGYYNHRRRREGEVFELLSDKSYSDKWMEKIEGETPRSKPKKSLRTEEAQTSSEEVI